MAQKKDSSPSLSTAATAEWSVCLHTLPRRASSHDKHCRKGGLGWIVGEDSKRSEKNSSPSLSKEGLGWIVGISEDMSPPPATKKRRNKCFSFLSSGGLEAKRRRRKLARTPLKRRPTVEQSIHLVRATSFIVSRAPPGCCRHAFGASGAINHGELAHR